MVCVYCGGKTQVVNSRLQHRPNQIWRRRTCLACGSLVTTHESVDWGQALSVSTPEGLQPFLRDKLFISIYESCKHRSDALEAAEGLTRTVLGRLLKKVQHASLGRDEVAQTAHEVLKRFDKAAAVHYQAYHPL